MATLVIYKNNFAHFIHGSSVVNCYSKLLTLYNATDTELISTLKRLKAQGYTIYFV